MPAGSEGRGVHASLWSEGQFLIATPPGTTLVPGAGFTLTLMTEKVGALPISQPRTRDRKSRYTG